MSKKAITLLALVTVYIIWGGTYLGIRLAVATIPPFLMAGSRFLAAGLAVYLGVRLAGAERPRREHWRDAGIAGALLLLGGNGAVSWAEQRVPSGIAALLVATVPLWMILLGWGGQGPDPAGGRSPWAASCWGSRASPCWCCPSEAGPDGSTRRGWPSWCWAACSGRAGSMYARHARVPASALLSVAMQMIVGGALMLAVSGLLGEWSRFEPARVTLRSLLGMGYLVLFGSILAYNAYIWLMKNADPHLGLHLRLRQPHRRGLRRLADSE